MTRLQLTEKILVAKRSQGLTWRQLADRIGRSPVWLTSALLGQMSLDEKEAGQVAALLGLDEEEQALLSQVPYRGSLPPGPLTDPLIYRFQEIVSVYGTTLKALIEEEFGDGIMSAIDLEIEVDRVADPKGDRVKVVLNGKFLPYRRY